MRLQSALRAARPFGAWLALVAMLVSVPAIAGGKFVCMRRSGQTMQGCSACRAHGMARGVAMPAPRTSGRPCCRFDATPRTPLAAPLSSVGLTPARDATSFAVVPVTGAAGTIAVLRTHAEHLAGRGSPPPSPSLQLVPLRL